MSDEPLQVELQITLDGSPWETLEGTFSWPFPEFEVTQVIWVKKDEAGVEIRSEEALGFTSCGIDHVVPRNGKTDPPLVSLRDRVRAPARSIKSIVEATQGQVSEADVRRVLDSAYEEIPKEEFYAWEERRPAIDRQLTNVVARLDLFDALGKDEMAKLLPSHRFALRVYLMLTCFDIIGGPRRYSSFPDWLRAKKHKHKDARESVPQGKSREEDAEALYNKYLDIYGVKNAFMRFFDERLEDAQRRDLFDSFDFIDRVPPMPYGLLPERDVEAKKEHLYRLRNLYTHMGEVVWAYEPTSAHPMPENLKGKKSWTMIKTEKLLEMTSWWNVDNWPEALATATRAGLVSLIEDALRELDSK